MSLIANRLPPATIYIRLALILALAACAFSAPPAFAQGERCGAGVDFVVQALEQIKKGTNDEAADGLQLLKHATEVCPSLGDAWYYRSVFEAKLGRANLAKYALDKAKMFGSDAMQQNANPFILAAPVQPQLTQLPPVHEKWALVVGISKFNEQGLDLKYTGKDARDFSDLLTNPAYGRFKRDNVHLLMDKVTTRQIREELNWLARNANEDDVVVIFLATHGTSRDMDTAELNYVVTSDTETSPADSLFATSLAMVDLSDIIRSRIKARRTVLILDTCHSGAATLGKRERALGVSEAAPSQGALERAGQGVGRAILTSSREGESSFEGEPYQNGYFTHFLIEAIRQNGGAGNIQQIYAQVRDGLAKAVAAASGGRGVTALDPGKPPAPATQTPVLDTSQFGSDIVLGVKPASAANLKPREGNYAHNSFADARKTYSTNAASH